ncbi:MAG TPA: LacI family DNA-binding transcriptional regulator [Candidatus Pullilachnospira intestinigallinarum]|nr:LacI family DNA-binding transcriptional regulator [Candidatus Pullilachnospira intestinigallinarum]
MATLNDIAQACGVSKATVSRVLNNDTRFSVLPETKEKIFAAAAALDYDLSKRKRPQKEARTLPSDQPEKSLKIGIINGNNPLEADKDNDYYAKIFSTLIATLNQSGYPFQLEFFYSFQGSYSDLNGLDGLIVLGKLTLNPSHPVIAAIKYKVFVDYISPRGLFDSVRCNFDEAVQLATSYFHQLNLYDIGFIDAYDHITELGVEGRIRTADPRQTAFENYCYRNQLDPWEHMWITEYFTSDDGYQITNELIRSGKLPSAVLYASDELALGGYKALQEHNLTIGKDVSVIGINDFYFTNFLNPPLTTVSLNIPLIGITAANALIDQIHRGRNYPLTIHTPVQLVVRQSCRPPKQA